MYSARITREHRSAFVILSDFSGSMAEEVCYRGETMSKADAVAMIINILIDELINRSRREDVVKDYFDIAVIGYGGEETEWLLGAKGEFITTEGLVRKAVKTRKHHIERLLPSGNTMTSVIEQKCWIEPRAKGSTLMGQALKDAEKMVRKWCLTPGNRGSFPPIVMNITDGEASDADNEELFEISEKIKDNRTNDGNVLLFNIHLASGDDAHTSSGVSFPSNTECLPCVRYARLLYDMASVMPECYNAFLTELNPLSGTPPFRAMGYNCAPEELFHMLTIGSVSVSVMV